MADSIFKIFAGLGLILLAVGLVFHVVGSPDDKLPAILFVMGAGLLVVSAVANARTLATFSKKRSARQGANAVFMTVLFTSILIVIQAISARNVHRYDVTRNKRFTLSDQTASVLERVTNDVTITAFFRQYTSRRVEADNLLAMYAHKNQHIQFTLVDPDQKPHIAERFRAREGVVVLEYKLDRWSMDELTEENLTNAILTATREVRKTLYFVTGHDEKRINDGYGSGFSSARQGLEEAGFAVHALSLVEVDSVPPDCSVLVLAGPKKELLQNEVDKIDAHLAGGGNALFLLDPRWPISRLEPVLERYHVGVENIVLLDELVVVDAGEEVFDATYTKIQRYEPHPITRDFRSITLFPVARPLAILPVEGDIAVSAQYLAITGKSAWGETDISSFRGGTATRDEADIPPPLAVALASERTNKFDAPPGVGAPPEHRSKIVVIGDSDFATNRFYGLLGNSDFFLNAVEYLSEMEIVVPIRMKAGAVDRVFISANQGRLVFILCLVLLPLTVISLGGYVFMRKRKT